MKKTILLTSYPFAAKNEEPLLLLKKNNFKLIDFALKKKRKLTKEEILKYISDADGIIAGTEKYDKEILSKSNKLKIISRLGIGLDNIDFKETKKRNIYVAYTPDAPSRAVAELTLGLIINSARRINSVFEDLKTGKWNRYVGQDISNKTVGIIGLGRIGKLLVKFLQPFNCNILINDINPDYDFIKKHNLKSTTKQYIYKNSDIISLHIPLTPKTKYLITKNELLLMKQNCILINTSRGFIVNEHDLYEHLKNNKDFFAAIDVFEKEPYAGNLIKLKNIILTPHLGSCSENSRYLMETCAVQNIIDFFQKNN
jgi:D-3-phosphoglycerate dehydrogenase / 2-oxoglutarate reductase